MAAQDDAYQISSDSPKMHAAHAHVHFKAYIRIDNLHCAAPTTVATLAVLVAADLFVHLDPKTLLPEERKQ